MSSTDMDFRTKLEFLQLDSGSREALRGFRKTLETEIDKVLGGFYAHVGALPDLKKMLGIGTQIDGINEIATTIAAAIEEQGAATQEIARNVQQASAGTHEVSKNMTQVTRAAEETGAGAGKVMEAAKDVTHQSDALKTAITAFLDGVKAA